jgi:oligopeptide/dipeptide ABC transporter ATP-binding protein
MYAGFIVETAPTANLFAAPRHPYTVGLLHSLPRLDQDRQTELVPIEGSPPDQLVRAEGCPFAPRCAWRVPACWRENPSLAGANGETAIVTTGPRASHRVSCHNPATAEEARAGHPLRSGFVAAAPPLLETTA